jgi:hypothetical protein
VLIDIPTKYCERVKNLGAELNLFKRGQELRRALGVIPWRSQNGRGVAAPVDFWGIPDCRLGQDLLVS